MRFPAVWTRWLALFALGWLSMSGAAGESSAAEGRFRLPNYRSGETNFEIRLVDLPMAGVDPGRMQMGQYPGRMQDPPRMYVNPLAKQWLDPGQMTVPRMDRSIPDPGRMSLWQLPQQSIDPGQLEVGQIAKDFVDPGRMQVRELWQPNPDPMPLRVDALPNVINGPTQIQLPAILKPTIQYRSLIFDPGSDQAPSVHDDYRTAPTPASPPRRRAVTW